MKTYFEPIMNIAAFDNADVITTSGLDGNFGASAENKNSFKSVKYNELNSLVGGFTDADSQVK